MKYVILPEASLTLRKPELFIWLLPNMQRFFLFFFVDLPPTREKKGERKRGTKKGGRKKGTKKGVEQRGGKKRCFFCQKRVYHFINGKEKNPYDYSSKIREFDLSNTAKIISGSVWKMEIDCDKWQFSVYFMDREEEGAILVARINIIQGKQYHPFLRCELREKVDFMVTFETN